MSDWATLLSEFDGFDPSPSVPNQALIRAGAREAASTARPSTSAEQRNGAGWTRRIVIGLVAATLTLAVVFVLALAAHSRSTAPEPINSPAGYPRHFAGFPAVGVEPSRPENDGELILQISPATAPERHIYADGRVIGAGDLIPAGANPLHMAFSQQWLTPQGVQLLRSRVLAIGRPAGLFTPQDHGFTLKATIKQGLSAEYQVRVGRHLKTTQVIPTRSAPAVTPSQIRALNEINTLIDRLPASAWKDPTIRPYIPSHYCTGWDRTPPDPAKLPSPAREVLARLLPSWKRHNASGTLTTSQARALFGAFEDAGLKLMRNESGGIDWRVPTAYNDPRYRYVDLGFGPGLPNGGC